jgi:sugar phosphate isomerase/epimerase
LGKVEDMRSENQGEMTRRTWLAAGLGAAGTLALGRRSSAQATPADSPYGPFKMGIQSYSLRGYLKDGKADLDKALAVTKDLGLHYWESYPAHIPTVTDPAEIARYKQKVAAEGISVIGYGVIHFSKNHDANKRIFEFAKQLGLGYLSADPDPDSFDSLDKLTEEYGVAVGIHNHGPGHRYAMIDTIAAAIKDHSPKVGCCVDTGHFLRSREDPVRAVEVFGKRVYGVHLKDVKDATKFTVLGKGDLRTADLLKVLAHNKYDYCLALEYEESEQNPADDLRACLAAAREAAATLKR